MSNIEHVALLGGLQNVVDHCGNIVLCHLVQREVPKFVAGYFYFGVFLGVTVPTDIAHPDIVPLREIEEIIVGEILLDQTKNMRFHDFASFEIEFLIHIS